MGRHLEVDGLALDELHRLLPQEAGDQVLLDLGRRGNDGREGGRRVGADRDGDLHAVAADACDGLLLKRWAERAAAAVPPAVSAIRSTALGGSSVVVARRRSRSCSAAFFCRCQCMPVVFLS